MSELQTISNRLSDVQAYAVIARDGWREGDKNKTLYWLEQTIEEAQDAISAILVPSVEAHEHEI